MLVLDDTGATNTFATGVSSPQSVAIPAGATGTWTWVVSRAGYSSQIGTIAASGGGSFSASPAPTQRLQPSGVAMYTGTTDANLAISFDLSTPGSERCFIDIGNATVSPQTILDEVEDALETEDGGKFLAATSGAECTFAGLAAGDFLFMGTGYRIRRASAGDSNATVAAFVISSDGVVVDNTNGDVAFLSSNLNADAVASAVWDALLSDHAVASSFGAFVAGLETEADAATRAATDQAEHDATQATLAALPVPLTAAQVNAEVDTALNDYDGPTKAELDTSEAAVIAALPAAAPTAAAVASQVRTELTTELGRIDADVSSRASQVTADADHDATQAAVAGLASPLDAAGVRAAVGLASADLDTQLAALPTDADVQTAAAAAITAAEPVAANITQVAGGAISGAADLQADTSALATQASVDVIDANVDAILVDTGTTIPAQLSALPTPLTAAEVNAEVDTALADYDGPTRAELSTDIGTLPTLAEMEASAALTATADVSGLSTHSAADVWAVGTREITGGQVDTMAGTVQTLDALDTAQDAQHATTQAALAGLSTPPTAAAIADAVWDEPRADHTTSGTMGESQPDQDLSGLSTHAAADVVTAMQAVAADFQADTSSLATAADLAVVDLNVDAILVDTGSTLPALISGTSAPSASAIAAQVRVELTTELAYLDASVSSRLASAGYTAPLNDTETQAAAAAAITAASLSTLSVGDVTGALTSQGYTTARAALLDNLDATVSSRPTASEIVVAMQAVATDFQADVSALSTAADMATVLANQSVINVGVQLASLIIPHNTDVA